jgi:hypothetical protein
VILSSRSIIWLSLDSFGAFLQLGQFIEGFNLLVERGTLQLGEIGIHFCLYWSSYLVQPLGGLLYQREHFVAAHTCLALEPSEDYSISAHSIVSDSCFYKVRFILMFYILNVL